MNQLYGASASPHSLTLHRPPPYGGARLHRGVRLALVAGLLLGLGASCGSDDEVSAPRVMGSVSDAPAMRFRLGAAALGNLRLRTVEAGPQVLTGQRTYPGVVRYKESARAHLVAQVEGVVREVRVSLGDPVTAASVVCLLDSRELGQARSAFLEALHRENFRETMFQAESDLWKKKVTSRDDYMRAEQDLTEARLTLATATQALRSLGLEEGDVDRLRSHALTTDSSPTIGPADGTPASPTMSLSELRCLAPMEGHVVDVLVSRGEAVSPGQGIVEVADLSSVWIDTKIPAHDLAVLKVGDPVNVTWAPGNAAAASQLIYISPEVNSSNQTALARIELANPNGVWRPGLFVSVGAEVQRQSVDLAVPTEALVADPEAPGEFLVFVQLKQGEYEATPVNVLRTDGGFAAIEGSLQAGDRVVVGETLFLKAVWLGEGGLEE